jgi:hypothetical protein
VKVLRILAAAAVLAAGVGGAAQANETWVNASGIATDPSQDNAYSKAAQNALESLGDKCGGFITTVSQTGVKSTQTTTDPPAWTITVSLRGLCHYDQDS